MDENDPNNDISNWIFLRRPKLQKIQQCQAVTLKLFGK